MLRGKADMKLVSELVHSLLARAPKRADASVDSFDVLRAPPALESRDELVTASMPRPAEAAWPRSESPRHAWRIVVVFALLALVVWGLLSVSVARRSLDVREGEVSQKNVRSPRKLTYTSQVRTKAERERAANAVQEVVEIDPTMVQRQRAGPQLAAPGHLCCP